MGKNTMGALGRVKRWWWVLLLLLLVPLLAAGGFVVWAESTPSPMPEVSAALDTETHSDGVSVTQDDWLVFRPIEREAISGLIFYPGGRVDPLAYAPAARAIAAQGHLVVVVPMPLNLAFFAPNRSDEVIQAFPDVEYWAVGGHSLGGAMAARFVHRHPSAVQGLVLWASYPAENSDLSDRDLSVVSIYATRDGLATPEEVEASSPLLPSDTRWVRIAGGNHAQFGWYGPQNGDNAATISREAQQGEAVSATASLLERIRE